MRREWNPEMAFNAYIDTIRALNGEGYPQQSGGISELVGAMAAGWNAHARTIIETYNKGGDDMSISIVLSVARRDTRGRHMSIVPDEQTRSQYASALGPDVEVEVIVVGDKERAVMKGVDFVVTDRGCREYKGLSLLSATLSCEGAVLLRKNSGTRRKYEPNSEGKGLLGWMKLKGVGYEMKVVRDVYLCM